MVEQSLEVGYQHQLTEVECLQLHRPRLLVADPLVAFALASVETVVAFD